MLYLIIGAIIGAVLFILGNGYKPWIRRSFINDTFLSDAQLLAAWSFARKKIANEGTFNNAANFALGKGFHGSLIVDKRALAVYPRAVKVTSVPDATISDLVKLNPKWSIHKDPSGAFIRGWRLAAGETYPSWLPKAPARVEVVESVAYEAAKYEFENVILGYLGYNCDGR